MTCDHDAGAASPLDVPRDSWTHHGHVPVWYGDVRSATGLVRALVAARRRRPTHVYVNTFFAVALALAPQLLGLVGWWRGATIVLAPRGEFGEWALASKAAKKRVYLAAYRLAGLHRRVVWHAATPDEAADIRRLWGDRARIVVDTPRSPLGPTARRGRPEASDVVRAVSYGRITRLKGLDVVLRGLATLPAGTRLHLDAYGPPEEPELLAECEGLAEALPDGVTWSYRGALEHAQVQDTLARYDVALMGTHGETYGHALAEVLSVGCPMLVADTTPWTPAVEEGGGIVVDAVTPEAWGAAVRRFLALDASGRDALRDGAADAFERAQQEDRPHLFDLVLEEEARHRRETRHR